MLSIPTPRQVEHRVAIAAAVGLGASCSIIGASLLGAEPIPTRAVACGGLMAALVYGCVRGRAPWWTLALGTPVVVYAWLWMAWMDLADAFEPVVAAVISILFGWAMGALLVMPIAALRSTARSPSRLSVPIAVAASAALAIVGACVGRGDDAAADPVLVPIVVVAAASALAAAIVAAARAGEARRALRGELAGYRVVEGDRSDLVAMGSPLGCSHVLVRVVTGGASYRSTALEVPVACIRAPAERW